MARSAWLALALAVCASAPRAVDACDCAGLSLTEALTGAAAVFEGTVLGRAAGLADPGATGPEQDAWSVEVRRVWKGLVPAGAGPLYDAAWCSASLRTGETYLFYASAGPRGPRYVSACNRVVPIAQAAGDLAKLGAPLAPLPSSAPPPSAPSSAAAGPRGACACTLPAGEAPWGAATALALATVGAARHRRAARRARRAG